jgi:cell division initiation protein
MRITPLEIRQHTFDKSFRGYDTESVDAFLLSLSQEWERIAEDLRQSKQQLEVSEREIIRMKEIENSLFKTLKAAEDAQQEINAKAQLEADKITDKANAEVSDIIGEAQKQANMIISEAENKAKFLVSDAVNDLKNYERDFKAMERYKDFLVVELKRFANDTLDKVTKFEDRMSNRTNQDRINQLDTPIAELPLIIHEPAMVSESEAIEQPIVAETIYHPDIIEVEEVVKVEEPKIEIPIEEVVDTEIDFEPASDYDDEDAELPTVHAIIHDYKTEGEHTEETVNTTAEDLIKEMKATRGRPRKLGKDDSLPTVSSVMEEYAKDSGNIANGGGSFFDNL